MFGIRSKAPAGDGAKKESEKQSEDKKFASFLKQIRQKHELSARRFEKSLLTKIKAAYMFLEQDKEKCWKMVDKLDFSDYGITEEESTLATILQLKKAPVIFQNILEGSVSYGTMVKMRTHVSKQLANKPTQSKKKQKERSEILYSKMEQIRAKVFECCGWNENGEDLMTVEADSKPAAQQRASLKKSSSLERSDEDGEDGDGDDSDASDSSSGSDDSSDASDSDSGDSDSGSGGDESRNEKMAYSDEESSADSDEDPTSDSDEVDAGSRLGQKRVLDEILAEWLCTILAGIVSSHCATPQEWGDYLKVERRTLSLFVVDYESIRPQQVLPKSATHSAIPSNEPELLGLGDGSCETQNDCENSQSGDSVLAPAPDVIVMGDKQPLPNPTLNRIPSAAVETMKFSEVDVAMNKDYFASSVAQEVETPRVASTMLELEQTLERFANQEAWGRGIDYKEAEKAARDFDRYGGVYKYVWDKHLGGVPQWIHGEIKYCPEVDENKNRHDVSKSEQKHGDNASTAIEKSDVTMDKKSDDAQPREKGGQSQKETTLPKKAEEENPNAMPKEEKASTVYAYVKLPGASGGVLYQKCEVVDATENEKKAYNTVEPPQHQQPLRGIHSGQQVDAPSGGVLSIPAVQSAFHLRFDQHLPPPPAASSHNGLRPVSYYEYCVNLLRKFQIAPKKEWQTLRVQLMRGQIESKVLALLLEPLKQLLSNFNVHVLVGQMRYLIQAITQGKEEEMQKTEQNIQSAKNATHDTGAEGSAVAAASSSVVYLDLDHRFLGTVMEPMLSKRGETFADAVERVGKIITFFQNRGSNVDDFLNLQQELLWYKQVLPHAPAYLTALLMAVVHVEWQKPLAGCTSRFRQAHLELLSESAASNYTVDVLSKVWEGYFDGDQNDHLDEIVLKKRATEKEKEKAKTVDAGGKDVVRSVEKMEEGTEHNSKNNSVTEEEKREVTLKQLLERFSDGELYSVAREIAKGKVILQELAALIPNTKSHYQGSAANEDKKGKKSSLQTIEDEMMSSLPVLKIKAILAASEVVYSLLGKNLKVRYGSLSYNVGDYEIALAKLEIESANVKAYSAHEDAQQCVSEVQSYEQELQRIGKNLFRFVCPNKDRKDFQSRLVHNSAGKSDKEIERMIKTDGLYKLRHLDPEFFCKAMEEAKETASSSQLAGKKELKLKKKLEKKARKAAKKAKREEKKRQQAEAEKTQEKAEADKAKGNVANKKRAAESDDDQKPAKKQKPNTNDPKKKVQFDSESRTPKTRTPTTASAKKEKGQTPGKKQTPTAMKTSMKQQTPSVKKETPSAKKEKGQTPTAMKSKGAKGLKTSKGMKETKEDKKEEKKDPKKETKQKKKDVKKKKDKYDVFGKKSKTKKRVKK